MKKLTTNRTIVVEGKYDAVKLNAIIDANIILTEGFRIYSNKEKQTLLKRLAQKNGLILLLDADGAGFRLRHFITNLVGDQNVMQLYTPAVKGKEKRKEIAGKEGLLGVEGIETQQLYQILETALAKETTMKDAQNTSATAMTAKTPSLQGISSNANQKMQSNQEEPPRQVTYTDLFKWGLSGTAGSAERKTIFLQSLDLPPRISKKALVEVLNRLYTYTELEEKQKALFGK